MTKGVRGVGSKVIFFFVIEAVAKLSARQSRLTRYVRDETCLYCIYHSASMSLLDSSTAIKLLVTASVVCVNTE